MTHPPSDDASAIGHDSASSDVCDTAPAITLEAPDYLPISLLNALLYCPRRFYYEYAQGEMLVKEDVLQGRVSHRVADAGGARLADGALTMRRVYVYSDRLRIAGLIDVVEAPLDGSESDASPDSPIATYGGASASKISNAEAGLPPTEKFGMYPREDKKRSAPGGGAHHPTKTFCPGLRVGEGRHRPPAPR